jgi:hypothetical protein
MPEKYLKQLFLFFEVLYILCTFHNSYQCKIDDSSISRVIWYRLDIWNSISSKDGIPLCYILTSFWTDEPRYPVGTRGYLFGTKWLDHEADHPPPSRNYEYLKFHLHSSIHIHGVMLRDTNSYHIMHRTSISVLKLIFLNKKHVLKLTLHSAERKLFWSFQSFFRHARHIF